MTKAYKIGDVCRYQHRDVEGFGTILSMGADGVWVESPDGRRCTIRHEAIIPPDDDD